MSGYSCSTVLMLAPALGETDRCGVQEGIGRAILASQLSGAPPARRPARRRFFDVQIARVTQATPDVVKNVLRPRHNLHQRAWRAVPEDQPATLAYFMGDYV